MIRGWLRRSAGRPTNVWSPCGVLGARARLKRTEKGVMRRDDLKGMRHSGIADCTFLMTYFGRYNVKRNSRNSSNHCGSRINPLGLDANGHDA
jgi:hypothetical protein